jgi:hypothetical protein
MFSLFFLIELTGYIAENLCLTRRTSIPGIVEDKILLLYTILIESMLVFPLLINNKRNLFYYWRKIMHTHI